MAKKNLISELSEQQLDELLAYTPTFSDKNHANIKARFMEEASRKVEKTKRPFRKAFLPYAAAILILMTSTAVFAAVTYLDLGHIFNSFFNNANVTNRFDVGKTVVREGIEITVISVYTDGLQAYAMLEIADLQENRLSNNLGLVFENRYYHAYIVTPIIYSEATRTALVSIRIDYQIPLDTNMAFTINDLLLGARNVIFEPIAFPLSLHARQRDMIVRAEWEEAASKGLIVDGGTTARIGLEEEPQLFLHINEIEETLPNADWAVITNIGLNNEFLHIQIRRTETWNLDSNFGHLNLLDENDEPIWSIFSIRRGDYTEYVFDIGSADRLDEITLAFAGMVVDAVVPGPWEFDISIAAQAEKVSAMLEIQNSQYFNQADITISPMTTSIRFFATNEMDSLEFVRRMRGYVMDFGDPFITLKDGTTVELFPDSVMFGSDGGISNFNSFYFDISQIFSITILDDEHLIER
ncbi:MAG: DUF4179 domain-containing protein [Defluviitaleaceae bacterium]|nr:DUF4179 domain-containing protein [Defluviitaleaceae bacterium]